MDYQKLEILLRNSPTLKLLRAKNAALIISFLYIQFREQNEITIKNENLVQKRAHYLDEHESIEDKNLPDIGLDNYARARKYMVQCRLSVHPKSYLKLKTRLKGLTGRSNGIGCDKRKAKLHLFIGG